MIWAATINVSVNVILADFFMNRHSLLNAAKANTIMAVQTVWFELCAAQSFCLAMTIGGPTDSLASQ